MLQVTNNMRGIVSVIGTNDQWSEAQFSLHGSEKHHAALPTGVSWKTSNLPHFFGIAMIWRAY
jgi:hypothetical protein